MEFMHILPLEVTTAGPGVDLSNLPEGVSIKMSDPVKDFAYSRNTVTMTFDLSAYVNVRLLFAAMEFGDEPHAPPASPFGDDVDFDGVAVSADGVAWYEIQDLRHLRSSRFTDYEIDLDAAIAALGLSYGSEFRIRFCQYDNNPAPMDGIFVHKIELTADLRAPVFHLPMDDNAANATVRDVSEGSLDQVFIDSTGDPNTAAHSVPGPNGTTALAFDGVDDRIDFGPTLLGDIVGEGRDFSMAFWYKSADPGGVSKYFFRRAASTPGPYLKNYIRSNQLYWSVGLGNASVSLGSAAGVLNDQWHHVVCCRHGETLTLWVDGTAHDTKTDPSYAMNLFPGAWSSSAIGLVYGAGQSEWPFAMADLRAYDRALTDEEIQTLYQP